MKEKLLVNSLRDLKQNDIQKTRRGFNEKGKIRDSKHTTNKTTSQNIMQSYKVPKARGSQWIFTHSGDGGQGGQGSPKDPAHSHEL